MKNNYMIFVEELRKEADEITNKDLAKMVEKAADEIEWLLADNREMTSRLNKQDEPKTCKEYDNVDNPKHYNNHPSGVECIEITRHMSFNIGNVIKYLWRADEKGKPIEDLEKAAWYLNDEIKRRKTLWPVK